MAGATTELSVRDLPLRQASALKRKAERMGLSTGAYIKQLIEDDLALDRLAANRSLEELGKPFRKALKGISDIEIDRIVSNARAKTSTRRR